uniref:Acyl-CoA thioesterase n=1 Tax=Caldiarchaeum subterraneum TaxID=311458 RepID=A0A7C4DZR7_CALS0
MFSSISSTVTESRFFVMPHDSNAIGRLHGGVLMEWMVSAAALCGVRFSKGEVVLAALDDLFFMNPVSVGDMVVVKAWVEYAGHSSMEVGVSAYAYPRIVGEPMLTTTSHMFFVAVDRTGSPRPLPTQIKPTKEEEQLYSLAEQRAEKRRKILNDRKTMSLDTSEYGPDARYRMKSSHLVAPSDATMGGIMSGGKLLHLLDEMAGAVAISYAKTVAVTGAVDSTSFHYPIRQGSIVDVELVLTGVGRSSAEVAAKVITENPSSGVRRHAATTFFTMVAVDSAGKPVPMPPFEPSNEGEEKRLREMRARRAIRQRRLEEMQIFEPLHRMFAHGRG